MLGFIPDFQFSPDANINPYVNPTVSMPSGMYQAGIYTTQPTYSGSPAITPPPPDPMSWSVRGIHWNWRNPGAPPWAYNPSGLGYVMAWPQPPVAGAVKALAGPVAGARITALPPAMVAALAEGFVSTHKWKLLAGLLGLGAGYFAYTRYLAK